MKQDKYYTGTSPKQLMKSTRSTNTGEKAENLWNAPNALAYAEKKLEINLDEWQREYIKHEGNTAVRASRQSGKSFAESLRVALFALLNPKTRTLIIASVDRQSIELLEKVKAQIMGLAKNQIKGRPTFHKLELKNGSKIMAEPAGQTGYGLRGFTVDKLVADEAHYIPDAVFTAIRPMLATTGGTLDLLSTPRGNEGFFYDVFKQDDFWTKHVRWEDCTRYAEGFIQQEKKRMTKLEFMQEYEAEFIDSLMSFFPRELYDTCILPSTTPKPSFSFEGRSFLGVDFGGYGGDQNAFVTLINHKEINYVENVKTTTRVEAYNTIKDIMALTRRYDYEKIGVDDGGLGSPILDFMMLEDMLRRRSIGLNNATRLVARDGKKKRLLKEDMYGNLKLMMEQGIIKFPEDDELRRSLMSIQFEIDKDTKNIKIFGRYSHICEGLIRAAWLAKSKGLNIMSFC